MKIARIESYTVRVPLVPERRMISSLGSHTVSNYVLVRLLTDDGVEGAGEATATPAWSGETVWGCQAAIDRVLAPPLIGCEVTDIAEIARRMDAVCKHNWFAKSAIEMACWDAWGKGQAKPVYELLGGACRAHKFKCRFSMGAYDLPRARRVAEERIKAGFTTIKVKVGGESDDDLQRVRAVREVIGPDRALDIDANCGWSVETAIRKIRALADCRLAVVEQPTPDGDYEALARVRHETNSVVMADDMCFDLVHARELVRHRACDILNVYPGKQGGIAKAKRMVDFAAEHKIACTIGSNLELDVGTAAMGHLIVACQNMQVEKYPGDALGPIYHEFSVVKKPVVIEGPFVTVPSGPGLGVEVDWDVVRLHPAAD
ncbi:MAG: muconate cycloisomerase [Planctomycetes bacterium]|nr:muconate cycloisomerase [Planctomycetota bacterium]